jgi:hypothetical protein
MIDMTARCSHNRASGLEDQRSWPRQDIKPMQQPIAKARVHEGTIGELEHYQIQIRN